MAPDRCGSFNKQFKALTENKHIEKSPGQAPGEETRSKQETLSFR